MTQSQSPEAEVTVIEAIRSGDRYAFGVFVKKHDAWVRGIVFGVLGNQEYQDDVIQRIWTTAWQRISELRDVTRWRPWLYQLARNAAIDAGRAVTRRRRLGIVSQLDDGMVAAPASPDGSMVCEESHRRVMAAIQSLPALYREPFIMRHINGWGYREIAEVMDMPADSVETRLVRARRFLREALKGERE